VLFQQKEIQNRADFPVSNRFIPHLSFLHFVNFICQFSAHQKTTKQRKKDEENGVFVLRKSICETR
jgi:hypothetical protein